MNGDDREKKILKQKTKSGVLIKKKRMGKVVYIEKKLEFLILNGLGLFLFCFYVNLV